MIEEEYHVVRISCFFKKVHLDAKFPCAIAFEIKNCN